MSFCGFRPALHVLLGGCVDVASRWGRELCTIVPSPEDAHPTVVDRRLQVLVVGPGIQNGSGWCCGAGFSSSSAASSSTDSLAGAMRLKGSGKLCVHSDELYRKSLERGGELGNIGAMARYGCC